MKLKMSKHRRALFVIPVTGVLLASSCFTSPSFAQQSNKLLQALSNFSEAAKAVPLESTRDLNSVESFDWGVASGSIASAETQDLVLAVTVRRRQISSGIFAVQENGQYYLPLVSLSQLLDFKYDIDNQLGTVEGWALDENDNYILDKNKNILTFRGQKVDLPSNAILDEEIADDDVYVLLDVLQQIWPTDLNVNLSALALNITPDKSLPFELAANRGKARDNLLKRRENPEVLENYPFVPYPYQAYSKPFVDLSASVGYDESRKGVLFTGNLNGVNDLAYASANYSLNFSQSDGEFNKPENIRLRFRRQNIHEGALPFGLEDVQAGDVRLRGRNLVSSSLGGRGVTFSNEVNPQGEFDQITIDGFGTPGWEIELYFNSDLIDFGLVDERGEYRFEDIPVNYGNNRFKLVLYGPQGQIEERVENYVYNSGLVRKGQNTIYGGLLEAGKDFIPIDGRRIGIAEGLAANIYAARGLTNKITAFASASRFGRRGEEGDDPNTYLSAGAITSLGSSLAQFEAYKQLDGGIAGDARVLSDYKGVKINANIAAFTQDYDGGRSNLGVNGRKFEAELGLRKAYKFFGAPGSTDYRLRYTKNHSSVDSVNQRIRLSQKVAGVSFGNSITTDSTDGRLVNMDGLFTTSSRHRRFNLRNRLNYSIDPETELTSFDTELRYNISQDYRTSLTGSYGFINDDKRVGMQISRDFQKYLASAEASWSSVAGYGVRMRASTSLGPIGDDDEYLFRAESASGAGPVGIFVYEDENSNNVFDGDDVAVEKARLKANRRVTREGTNERGKLVEILSAVRQRQNVGVFEDSIEDPYLVPTVAGYSIRPRPGVVHKLDFPLIETGAIDGSLLESNGGKPIGGVKLQLLNGEGDVVQETFTGVDGYYTFERIRPGDFTIRVDPEEEMDVPLQYVSLTDGDMFKFGTDVLVSSDNSVEPLDLDVKVANDGSLNVNDIVSLAKGYKEKKRNKLYKAVASNGSNVNKTANGATLSSVKPRIDRIRIGEHPNKVRIVMDLSGPLDYSINFDPQNNFVTVELPYASWGASRTWNSNNSKILNNYSVENSKQGVKLMIGVNEGVDIGASGLLKATGSKDDRLYIDIEKK